MLQQVVLALESILLHKSLIEQHSHAQVKMPTDIAF